MLIYRGSWQEPIYCEKNMAICGIAVRMDIERGAGAAGNDDDTALNGAKFRCCPLPPLSTAKTISTHQPSITPDSFVLTTNTSITKSSKSITLGIIPTCHFLILLGDTK